MAIKAYLALAFLLVGHLNSLATSDSSFSDYSKIVRKKQRAPAYWDARDVFTRHPKTKDYYNSCLVEHKKTIVDKSQSMLKKMAGLHLKDNAASINEVFKAVCFLKSTKRELKKDAYEQGSLYIHPVPSISIFPLQVNISKNIFNKNVKYYWHFKDFDPNSKAGGFKKFSRSIEFHSEEIVANLESDTERPNQINNILNELSILNAFQGSGRHLFSYSSAIFTSQKNNPDKIRIAFQTPLFARDLANFDPKISYVHEWLLIAKEMAEAVLEMHQKGYVHRDVKPHNFLMNHTPGEVKVVLADFGLCLLFHEVLHPTSLPGTRGFKDPALVLKIANRKEVDFDSLKAADTFSLGMSYTRMFLSETELFELNKTLNNEDRELSGTSKISQLEATFAAFKDHYELRLASIQLTGIRLSIFHLIFKMMHPDPAERPSLANVVKELAALLESI